MFEDEEEKEKPYYKLNLGNVHLERAEAPLNSVTKRVEDGEERLITFKGPVAQQQASRCLKCATAFCSQGKIPEIEVNIAEPGCGVDNDCPDFLEQYAAGDIKAAARTVLNTNKGGDIVCRVCPAHLLCESGCTNNVTIKNVEAAIMEEAWEKGLIDPIEPLYEHLAQHKVAVIGSGYAGLGIATKAVEYGYSVTMFDREKKPGGMAREGIPAQKLAKHRIDRYFNRLVDTKLLNLQMGVSIGAPNIEATTSEWGYEYKPFSDLVREYDAIFICTGAYSPKSARLGGDAAKSVISSINFLKAHEKERQGSLDVTGYKAGWYDMKDKDVVIIGGGATLVDCITGANDQKAKNIRILYYKGLEVMPAYNAESKKDMRNAMEEMGIKNPEEFILDFTLAKDINQRPDGTFVITAVKTEYNGEFDEWGGPKFNEIPGSEHEIITDVCMNAVGFNPENPGTLFNVDGFQLNQGGTLKHHPIPSRNKKGAVKGAGYVGTVYLSDEFKDAHNCSAQVYVAGDMGGTDLAVYAMNAGIRTMEVAHDGIRYPERLKQKWGADTDITLTANL